MGPAKVPVGGGGARPRCWSAVAGPGRASDEANRPQHNRPHRCGGRRRDRRTWLRCPWAVAGPGRGAGRRWQGQGGPRTRRIVLSTTGPTGVEATGGTGEPGCGATRAAAGPGRASRRRAEPKARGADGERAGRRPRAHRAARPKQTVAPGTPVAPQATQRPHACAKPRPADAGRGSPTQSGGRV